MIKTYGFNFCDKLEEMECGEICYYDDHIKIVDEQKQEIETLKIEVAKFRGKNNYKTLRIKRLIKKGLVRMVQIEKLEDDKNKLLKAINNMAVSQIEINAENAKLKGEAI